MEPPEELDTTLKMPAFSEKEEESKKKENDENESFDAFLARQPHNPRPRLIYQPDKDLLEKDEREGTMGRLEITFRMHRICTCYRCELVKYNLSGTRRRIDF